MTPTIVSAVFIAAASSLVLPAASASEPICAVDACLEIVDETRGAGSCDDPAPYYSASRAAYVVLVRDGVQYDLGAYNVCSGGDYRPALDRYWSSASLGVEGATDDYETGASNYFLVSWTAFEHHASGTHAAGCSIRAFVITDGETLPDVTQTLACPAGAAPPYAFAGLP